MFDSTRTYRKWSDPKRQTVFLSTAITFRSNVVNNVRGTESLVELCKGFEKMESFVHISTAYSFCERKRIEEKVYDIDFTAEDIDNLLK